MMKTSKECDESRWDRAIKLLSESLGAAQACRPVNGPPIRYNPDCLKDLRYQKGSVNS